MCFIKKLIKKAINKIFKKQSKEKINQEVYYDNWEHVKINNDNVYIIY
jgi:hypothetical protein